MYRERSIDGWQRGVDGRAYRAFREDLSFEEECEEVGAEKYRVEEKRT